MSTDPSKFVFVYGSLRSGEYNNYLLARSTKICDATVRGFDLYSLGAFPAVIPSSNSDVEVIGEVFNVDPLDLAVINRMERGAGYTVHEVAATPIAEPAKPQHAIIYVFSDSNWLKHIGELVPSGDWLKR